MINKLHSADWYNRKKFKPRLTNIQCYIWLPSIFCFRYQQHCARNYFLTFIHKFTMLSIFGFCLCFCFLFCVGGKADILAYYKKRFCYCACFNTHVLSGFNIENTVVEVKVGSIQRYYEEHKQLVPSNQYNLNYAHVKSLVSWVVGSLPILTLSFSFLVSLSLLLIFVRITT